MLPNSYYMGRHNPDYIFSLLQLPLECTRKDGRKTKKNKDVQIEIKNKMEYKVQDERHKRKIDSIYYTANPQGMKDK